MASVGQEVFKWDVKEADDVCACFYGAPLESLVPVPEVVTDLVEDVAGRVVVDVCGDLDAAAASP